MLTMTLCSRRYLTLVLVIILDIQVKISLLINQTWLKLDKAWQLKVLLAGPGWGNNIKLFRQHTGNRVRNQASLQPYWSMNTNSNIHIRPEGNESPPQGIRPNSTAMIQPSKVGQKRLREEMEYQEFLTSLSEGPLALFLVGLHLWAGVSTSLERQDLVIDLAQQLLGQIQGTIGRACSIIWEVKTIPFFRRRKTRCSIWWTRFKCSGLPPRKSITILRRRVRTLYSS